MVLVTVPHHFLLKSINHLRIKNIIFSLDLRAQEVQKPPSDLRPLAKPLDPGVKQPPDLLQPLSKPLDLREKQPQRYHIRCHAYTYHSSSFQAFSFKH